MKLDFESVLGVVVTFLTGKELWSYIKEKQKQKSKELERDGKEIDMYRQQAVKRIEEMRKEILSKDKIEDQLKEDKLHLSSALARAEEQIKSLEKDNKRLVTNLKSSEEYLKELLKDKN